MRVNAYAAPAAGEPLAPVTIDRREVGPDRAVSGDTAAVHQVVQSSGHGADC
jgi:hypothetical protein